MKVLPVRKTDLASLPMLVSAQWIRSPAACQKTYTFICMRIYLMNQFNLSLVTKAGYFISLIVEYLYVHKRCWILGPLNPFRYVQCKCKIAVEVNDFCVTATM